MLSNQFWSKDRQAYFIAFSCLLFPFSFDAVLAVSSTINSSFSYHTPLTNSLISVAYAIGVGLGHLFFGPVFDLKNPIRIFALGMAVLFITAIAICFSVNIYQFILARFLQGLAISTQLLATRYIINDYFPNEVKSAQIYSITYTVSFIGALVSPLLAVYLIQTESSDNTIWCPIFVVIALLTMCVLVMMLSIPNLYKSNTSINDTNYFTVFNLYFTVLLNPVYTVYMLLSSLFASLLYLYFLAISFVMQDLLHIDSFIYASLLSLNMLCAAIGSMINTRLLVNYSIDRILQVCYQCFFVVSVLLLALVVYYNFTTEIGFGSYYKVYLLNLCFIIMVMIYAIASPNLLTKLLSVAKDKDKGNVIAVLGIMQFVIGLLVCNVIGFIAITYNSILVISLGMILLSAGCLLLDFFHKNSPFV